MGCGDDLPPPLYLRYLVTRKELLAQIFSSVNSFLQIPVQLMVMNRTIACCLLLKLVLTILLDVTFLSELGFSLQLGPTPTSSPRPPTVSSWPPCCSESCGLTGGQR